MYRWKRRLTKEKSEAVLGYIVFRSVHTDSMKEPTSVKMRLDLDELRCSSDSFVISTTSFSMKEESRNLFRSWRLLYTPVSSHALRYVHARDRVQDCMRTRGAVRATAKESEAIAPVFCGIQ